MTTDALSRRVRELFASRGFLDGWTYDAQVRQLLRLLVDAGELTYFAVDWATPRGRSAALESWSRRGA